MYTRWRYLQSTNLIPLKIIPNEIYKDLKLEGS